uniref:Gelsolin-like domain-containing protein n=1 Tax=Heterorhabditis bacteriophora TaxID=37862 RepID=A0A1I7XDG4_HETBA
MTSLTNAVRGSIEYLDKSKAYFIDNGVLLFLWIGLGVAEAWVQDVFGANSVALLNTENHIIPEKDNPRSRGIRRAMELLQRKGLRRRNVFIVREGDSLEPWMKKFLVERQYYGVYSARLDILKPRIIEAAKHQLGEEIIYKQLENLDLHEKALVIGTIEKRISQRPSILKELAEDEHILPDDFDVEGCLVSSKDFLEFEDEKQIVKLEGNITMDEVATGCTVGLFGSQVGVISSEIKLCFYLFTVLYIYIYIYIL